MQQWRTMPAALGLCVALVTAVFAAAGLAADRKPVAIRGQVVGADGVAIAHADVFVTTTTFFGAEAATVVLARPVCDADGQFAFEVDADEVQELGSHSLAFWAHAPGHALGKGLVNLFQPPNGRPVLVELPAEFTQPLMVLDSSGAPIVGARVTPQCVGDDRWIPPQELCERAAGITDHEGVAPLPLVEAAALGSVLVVSPDRSSQLVTWTNGSHLPQVTLGATTKIHVTLTAGGAPLPAGRTVDVRVTLVDPLESSLTRQERRRLLTDDQGAITLEHLLQGTVALQLEPDRTFPWQLVKTLLLDKDLVASVEIDAVWAFEVAGRVVDAGDGAPIAGAVVESVAVPPSSVVSDREGAYRLWSTALRAPTIVVREAPRPWCVLPKGPYVEVAVPTATNTTAPIAAPLAVARGRAIRGQVHTADGKPAAGAWVKLARPDDQDLRTFRWPTATICDSTGAFALTGIERGLSWLLTAQRGDEALREPITIDATDEDVIGLEIAVESTGALGPSVLVVRESGEPIVGARPKLWRRYVEPQHGMRLERDVDGESGETPTALTDADGRATYPRRIDATSEYRWVVSATGFALATSEWFRLDGDGGDHAPARVTLRPLAAIRGRVVDRSGRPLAGVRLFQSGDGPRRTETRSDADGRFELAGYLPGNGFLFAEATGYRRRGMAIVAPTSDVTLALARSDEPPWRALHTLAPPIDRAAELATADALLAPVMDVARAHPDDGPNHRLLQQFACVDPARGLTAIDHGLFQDSWFRDYARRPIAQQLLAADLDDALAVVQSMETAQFRTAGFLDAVERRPDMDAATRRALLFEALANARQIDSPGMRVVVLARVAEHFAEHDDPELAQRILAEAMPNAGQLGSDDWEEYARGAFAEELASFDLPRALALCDSLKDPNEYDRHRANIAHELAGRDPQAAERVLGEVRQPTRRDRATLRVCYRMAPLDLARAEAIAQRIGEPQLRAQAHLFMARALADGEPDAARELLLRGFAELETIGRGDEILTNYDRCVAGLGLAHLVTAEAVAPELVDELLWRALSWRRAQGVTPDWELDGWIVQRDGSIALGLARYDRDAARHLLASLDPSLPELLAGDHEETTFALQAWALIDPDHACQLLDSDAARIDPSRATTSRDYRRGAVIGMLARPSSERFDAALESALGVWIPDTED